MRLCQVIEELSLDNDSSNYVINNIIRLYNDRDMIELSNQFLKGVGQTDQVPGKVIDTLWGINQWYYEVGPTVPFDVLTLKQKFYILANCIKYWSHMSVESRSQLML